MNIFFKKNQPRKDSDKLYYTARYGHYCVVRSSWKFKWRDAVSNCRFLYMCFVYFISCFNILHASGI